MFTLSELSRAVMRLVLPDYMASGTATAGTTTSLTDSALTYADQWFDKGTLWILSGTHAGKVLTITGHRGSTLTFSTTLTGAIQAGDRYMVARAAYPYQQIKTAIQTALDDTFVLSENATLEGDGDTLEFNLPTGVYNIAEVWIENPDDKDSNYKSSHWKEKNGKLRFDYGYPPRDGWTIRVIYKDRHDDLIDYDDELDAQINEMWLRYTAARYLLDWGMGMYKAQSEYRIEERMNLVLEKLKGVSPRNDVPDLKVRTAGSH